MLLSKRAVRQMFERNRGASEAVIIEGQRAREIRSNRSRATRHLRLGLRIALGAIPAEVGSRWLPEALRFGHLLERLQTVDRGAAIA